jgi:quinol-cytochrome oxidoreductase complex cytochrome b subunit
MTSAIVNLNPPDTYLHWGFILISLANFLVVVAMLVLFALAVTVPFVHHRRRRASEATETATDVPAPTPAATADPGLDAAADTAGPPEPAGGAPEPALWTTRLRRQWLRRLPPAKLLPDSQPAYVASWIYVFGVLTLAGLLVAIASGLVLALEGPAWWHTSTVGHFVNSLHLWSVECFMGFMAIHLWGKFWMAAWRGRRALTWITGVVAFLCSVFEAFTGYLSQTNFDSQWIAFEAKDAMNAGGIGAFFNTMNFGQALMLHIVFVPLVLVAIVALHILMVRLRGVVPPIEARPEHLDPECATAQPAAPADPAERPVPTPAAPVAR